METVPAQASYYNLISVSIFKDFLVEYHCCIMPVGDQFEPQSVMQDELHSDDSN